MHRANLLFAFTSGRIAAGFHVVDLDAEGGFWSHAIDYESALQNDKTDMIKAEYLSQ